MSYVIPKNEYLKAKKIVKKYEKLEDKKQQDRAGEIIVGIIDEIFSVKYFCKVCKLDVGKTPNDVKKHHKITGHKSFEKRLDV